MYTFDHSETVERQCNLSTSSFILQSRINNNSEYVGTSIVERSLFVSFFCDILYVSFILNKMKENKAVDLNLKASQHSVPEAFGRQHNLSFPRHIQLHPLFSRPFHMVVLHRVKHERGINNFAKGSLHCFPVNSLAERFSYLSIKDKAVRI